MLEEIQTRADIVNVISEYVLLSKKGKNYLGLCPFHNEKTPSFTVTPDKQMFYCFGCQTGGNVFTFLQKKENISFAEAVKILADKTGISLPQVELSPEALAKQQREELIAQVNKLAKDYYHNYLLTNPDAQAARDYLARRGIDRATIDAFQIGFAPEGWTHLLDFLSGHSFAVEQMIAAGLVTPNDRGSGYDRFRNRVVFPIFNVRGQVIGFGGRVLDDSLPKYLNSPETDFFSKGHNLYGLNRAYKHIREKGESLVVEGYMDVISAHQHGIENAVASLGTALTRDQGKLLLRYASSAVLAYDSDAAGVNAAFRGAEILRNLGCRVRVLAIPSGKDPDEFLRQHPAEEFTQLIANSSTWVEFKLASLVKNRVLSNIETKVEIVNTLTPDILKTESLVEREGYIRLIANTLGITEEVVYAEIQRISTKSRKIGSFSDNSKLNSHTNIETAQLQFTNDGNNNTTDAQKNAAGMPAQIFRAENMLLRLMLSEPKVIALFEEKLDWDAFKDPVHARILQLIKEAWQNGNWNPLNMAASVEDTELSSYIAKLNMQDTGITDLIKGALDCINIIKNERHKVKIRILQEQAQLMQNSGDIEGALKLLQEINRLVKQPASVR